MTAEITSPTDGQTGTGNPLYAFGGATDADSVQARIERNGRPWSIEQARFVDDENVFATSDTGGDLVAAVDLRGRDRLAGTAARFVIEWTGYASVLAAASSQTLVSIYPTGSINGTGRHFRLYIDLAGKPSFAVRDNTANNEDFSNFGVDTEYDMNKRIGVRAVIDMTAPLEQQATLYKLVGDEWEFVRYSAFDTNNIDIGTLHTAPEATVYLGGLGHTTGQHQTDQIVTSTFRWSDHLDTSLIDLDLTRDLDPDTGLIVDGNNNVWTPTEPGLVVPRRETHWVTADTGSEWRTQMWKATGYLHTAPDTTGHTGGAGFEHFHGAFALFSVEIDAVVGQFVGESAQSLLSRYHNTTERSFYVYINGAGALTVAMYDDSGGSRTKWIPKALHGLVDGEPFSLRVEFHMKNTVQAERIKIMRKVDGVYVEYDSDDVSTSGSTNWVMAETADVHGFTVGQQSTVISAGGAGSVYAGNPLGAGSGVFAARIIDRNDVLVSNIDVGADASAGATGPFEDSLGEPWYLGFGDIVNVQYPNTIDPQGVGSWSYQLPELDPVEHVLLVREIVNGVNSEPAQASFTPFDTGMLGDVDDLGRFLRRATGRYLWATAMKDPNQPTVRELRDATDISRDVRETSDSTTNSEGQTRRTITSPQEETVPGVVGGTSFDVVFNDRNHGRSPYRALFEKGARGFLIRAPYGTPSSGDRVEVFPATSGGNADTWAAGNVPALFVARLHVDGQVRRTRVVA